MERLYEEVRRELSQFDGASSLADLVAAWPDAVGAAVARNAWPARLARDRTLHVATTSSAWAFELAQLAPAVLERLRHSLGALAPTALRFAVGRVPEPALREDERGPRAMRVATPEEQQLAGALAAAIDDEELRGLVARAAAASLARDGSDSRF